MKLNLHFATLLRLAYPAIVFLGVLMAWTTAGYGTAYPRENPALAKESRSLEKSGRIPAAIATRNQAASFSTFNQEDL